MASVEDPDLQSPSSRPKDTFSSYYIIASIAVAIWFWVAAELDKFLNLSLALVPIVGLPALVLAFVLAIALLLSLFQRRWRRVVSVFVAPFIAISILYGLIHSGLSADFVLLQLRKSAYLAEVDKLPDPPGTRLKTWAAGETGGVGVANIFYHIVYDESGEITLPQGQWSAAWRARAERARSSDPSLWGFLHPSEVVSADPARWPTTNVQRLDGNFYLLVEIYQ